MRERPIIRVGALGTGTASGAVSAIRRNFSSDVRVLGIDINASSNTGLRSRMSASRSKNGTFIYRKGAEFRTKWAAQNLNAACLRFECGSNNLEEEDRTGEAPPRTHPAPWDSMKPTKFSANERSQPDICPSATAPAVPAASDGVVRWVEFKVMGDSQGSLVALEANRHIPFPIARVYYIFGTHPGVSRGFHAHKALNQLCVAVSGSCRMLLDDGRRRSEAHLDRPDRGLLIGPGLWREMHEFSPGCVLMVLADAPYDESDYIRDYDRFLNHVRR